MKNLASKVVIETQYIPTIAFYSYALNNDSIVIEKWENYQKGGFRNRCRILSAQGPLVLSIPLLSGKNEQQNIQEVKIDNTMSWATNHVRSIISCYGNAPFFEFYIDIIKNTLDKRWNFLFDLNNSLLSGFSKILGMEEKINYTKKFLRSYSANYCDRRNFISPKKRKKQNLNHDFDFKSYEQVFSEECSFEANLSILDLLFCKGPEAESYLKQIYRHNSLRIE